MKEYTVADLFYTRWEQLTPRIHSEVFALQQHLQQMALDSPEYGFTLIQILRRLRKNKSLVNKINEAQAVDIYNDLAFLDEPWYYFPSLVTGHRLSVTGNFLNSLRPPEPHMARHSFDQFIYADNEFSMFTVKQDELYLRRLAVTLYRPDGEEFFDKETVAEYAERFKGKLKPWQLNLVFFTYAQIRAYVMKRCKTLLPSGAKSDAAPTNTGPMWNTIKHQAARTLVFGTFDQTGQANMYSVLDHLEILCKEKDNAKP